MVKKDGSFVWEDEFGNEYHEMNDPRWGRTLLVNGEPRWRFSQMFAAASLTEKALYIAACVGCVAIGVLATPEKAPARGQNVNTVMQKDEKPLQQAPTIDWGR